MEFKTSDVEAALSLPRNDASHHELGMNKLLGHVAKLVFGNSGTRLQVADECVENTKKLRVAESHRRYFEGIS